MAYQAVVDFGLVVLIWLVQLIIYPGFAYYAAGDLERWHTKYVRRITVVVVPLMFAQLGLHAWEVAHVQDAKNLAQCVCIAGAWAVTFLVAVPLHNAINTPAMTKHTLERLVRWNWPRTIAWTCVFALEVGV